MWNRSKGCRLLALFRAPTIQREELAEASSEIAIARTEHYEDLSRGKVQPGMPTHIPKLDEMLTGGLKAGKLYILPLDPLSGNQTSASRSL